MIVVAGLTEDIEASVHHAVLGAGNATVAVVAGSPDIPYPSGQKHLHAKVKERGCVVGTEQRSVRAGRTRPTAKDRPIARGIPINQGLAGQGERDPLLERNQLIAELVEMVVLVEATRGAAAVYTAEAALELGKEVGAVPGRITEESAAGPNRLIRDGAHPILEAEEVLDLLSGF